MRFTALIFSLFVFSLFSSYALAYQIPTTYGSLDISARIKEIDYTTGPVTAKIPEGDTIEVLVDFTPSTTVGLDLKLVESNSGSLSLLEGASLGTAKSYSGLNSGDKKTTKWVLKVTGSSAATQLDLYFKIQGEGLIESTQNIANITTKLLQPEKIKLLAPERIPLGYSGNLTVDGEFFPKDIKLNFLINGSEDPAISAALINYTSITKLVFSLNVSKNAALGKRGIKLSKASGTAFTFDNLVDIVGEGGDFSGDLKIDHDYVSRGSLAVFYAYAPDYKGVPKIAISSDPLKQSYSMEKAENRTGLFVFSASLDKIGLKKGDLASYSVNAGNKIATKSGTFGQREAETTKSLEIAEPEISVYESAGFLSNLKISPDVKLLFDSILAGLSDAGAVLSTTGEIITVNIPNTSEYEGTVNDFHITTTGGKITDCKSLFPEWVCKILEKGDGIDLSGPNSKPLPAGTPVNITSITGENITITEFWATSNGTRIYQRQKFEPKEVEDCTDTYCPGLTGEQLKSQFKNNFQEACDRIKTVLQCLKSGKINIVMNKISKGFQPALKNPANIQKLIAILEAALKKCDNLVIECDSKWNYGCWNEDVNAYVHVYHGIGDNLHICPGFCTEKDPAGTLLHELTHFGDSTDDVNDDTSAHNIALMAPSIENACK